MKRMIVALIGAVLFALPLFAQEGAEDTAASLTLAEALATAREENPEYRIALSDLELADTRDRGVWAAFLPSLSLSFGTGVSQSRRFTGEDEFGQTVRRDEPAVYTSSRSSQGVGFGSITLFDGGRTFANARMDQASARSLRAGVAVAATALEAGLARSYYAAVVADGTIALDERMLESARQTLEGTRRLMRIGMKDPVDLLGAELQVAEREQELERARGAARMARLGLGQEMGVGREVAGQLVDGLPEPFDPATLDADALIEAALQGSSRVAQLEASVGMAESRLDVARGGWWPTVSVGVSTGRSTGGRGSGALFDLNPLDQSYGVNFALSLPVFSRFQTADAITEARVGQTAAEETLRAGRLAIESEVRGAVIDLENAYRDIHLAERAADLSRRRLELTQEKYRLGGASFEELRTATEDAFQREYAVLTARQSFAEAELGLEEAVGFDVSAGG